ncbi:hypothetical protein BVY12_22495, partial [Pseudomonas amygdali pv. morsprunorum]
IGNQEEDADRSSLYKGLLLILAGGRGSELVREYGVSGYTFLAIIPALSRTSSLPQPSARIKSGFVYNDEHSGVGTIARVSPTSKNKIGENHG